MALAHPVVGKIVLPSSILQFWDLGGQRDIRNIWEKYYDECHAVVYVVDASDLERMSEGWEVFGAHSIPSSHIPCAVMLRLRSDYRHCPEFTANIGCATVAIGKQTRSPWESLHREDTAELRGMVAAT